jgi:glycosyltransferase involved in cell wall biosynthesis
VTPNVSVIVPFKARTPFLEECLAHLARQTYRSFDVYLVPDEAFAPEDNRLHVMASGPVLPNRKRQIAAAASDAEIIAFIDDDAYPAPGWLAAAVEHFTDPTVVAAGGPAVTPAGDSPRQRASGAIFAASIVSSSTRRRYVPEAACDVDILPSCNLLVRREAFLRDADASAAYWPGEDTLACLFATRHGERIVYDPAVRVYHHRRAVFAAHLRQVWSYGRFRGFFLRRYGRSPRYAPYAAPAAFLIAHAGLLAAILRSRSRRPALAVAGVYAALVAGSALREARAAGTNPWLVGAGIYLTHIVYGYASIVGWLRGVPTPKNGPPEMQTPR